MTATGGTGAVHTAPGHGVDDYEVGLQYNLKVDNPVGGNGVYLPTAPIFAGEHIYKANPQIIATLAENNKLWAHHPIKHSYPHCWRHKTPIIFRATPQWFINMDAKGLRQGALNAIENDISFVPDWGKNRIQAMIEGRPDWCISRQRTWGVPIPFFVHKDTNELHPRTPELIEDVAKLIEQEGIDGWYNREAKDFIGDDAEHYNAVRDTLDVWFDSGTTHYAVLREREELQDPADLYLEGSDQHRGWFQSSLLTSIAINERAPYKGLLTHGFVVDEKGRTIEKGRDLSELEARCRTETHRPVKQSKGEFQTFPEQFVFEAAQKVTGVVVKQFQALVPTKAFSKLDAKDESGVVIQTFNDQSEAIRQHREGVIRLLYVQLGDLSRQLKKQIAKPLALAYSPLGDKAQLEQMLIYATLQSIICDLPVNLKEFQNLQLEVKKSFLSHGQTTLRIFNEIYIAWQDIRRQLLMLDETIFAKNIDDIEDQLDLMHLADFVYSKPVEVWSEYPRYLKALLLRLDRLPNNLQRDNAAIAQIDPWMDKLFKHKQDARLKELYFMVEELRISLFSQPMKTKMPISATRLQKVWEKLGIS